MSPEAERDGLYLGTIKEVWSAGLQTSILAGIAVVVGSLILYGVFQARNLLIFLIVAPAIGSGVMWILLLIMRLVGLLFGSLLVAAEMITAFSVGFPFVGLLLRIVWAERENAIVDRVVKQIPK